VKNGTKWPKCCKNAHLFAFGPIEVWPNFTMCTKFKATLVVIMLFWTYFVKKITKSTIVANFTKSKSPRSPLIGH